MKSHLQKSDLVVRAAGLGLLLVCAALLTLLHPHHAIGAGHKPTVTEFCLAFLAVCSGSVGASMVFVGRLLFAPVAPPRGRYPAEMNVTRTDRR